ncbi:hypothetical protein EK904_014642 [Melospiza melodia maxima]|nr:hypothetical protein EK904_014642 [Melospiza melodia maxima]
MGRSQGVPQVPLCSCPLLQPRTPRGLSSAGVSPSEILAPALYHGYYIRPRINKQLERGTSEVCLNQHKFQVFLDVCQFLPDELSVRTVDNLLEQDGWAVAPTSGSGTSGDMEGLWPPLCLTRAQREVTSRTQR